MEVETAISAVLVRPLRGLIETQILVKSRQFSLPGFWTAGTFSRLPMSK